MIDQAEEEERLRKQDEADGMLLLQNYVQNHFKPESQALIFLENIDRSNFFKV